ncbi:MAG: mechanosensitive ion channel family protein [Algicola sp.]|nr:mechanosensitive ion channel family protein [Algicola sp.]
MIESGQQTIETYLNLLSNHVFVQVGIVLAATWILAVLVDRAFLSWMGGFVAKVDKDNPLVHTKHGPLYYSVILLGFAIVQHLLELSAFNSTISSVLMTLAILVWARFGLRFIRFLLRSTAQHNTKVSALTPKTLPLFENMAFIFIIAITIYYVFINWNVDMTAWLASAGIVGIAVGFAAKDTLANLFSGIFIMADAPYEIGDFVVLDGGERGEITKIGIRSTRLLTRDDVEITVPNAIMGNTKIFNESGGRHQKSRIRVKVDVAYGCDIDKVSALLMKIGVEEPATCNDPEPRVRFRAFGPSGLNFELCCWIEEPVLRGRILHALNTSVYKAFIEHGIEIPYNKQDLYIKEMPGKQENIQ